MNAEDLPMSEFFNAPEAPAAVDEETSFPVPEQETESAEALTLSVDEFAALEERVVRTVELVKRERAARASAEEKLSTAELQMVEQSEAIDRLENDVRALRTERDQVRQRVERLLGQLDALEL